MMHFLSLPHKLWTHKYCAESWILIFVCSSITVLAGEILTGLLSLALAGGFAGLTPHRHTVLQKLQAPVLLPTLRSNLHHLWSLQHHTHIFIVQNTYNTHIHNFKINAPSVCSRCFPVCPTHLLHAVNLKCQVSKSYTYCNSLIMCSPKVVLIFRLYVPATNTSQHCLESYTVLKFHPKYEPKSTHCSNITSKINLYVYTHTYLRCESTGRSESTVTNTRNDFIPQWCKTPISVRQRQQQWLLISKWTVFSTLFFSHFHF